MNADTERDFVSFVEARSHSLFRMALALTADRQQAEDLLQSVLARAYRRWSRIEGNPETYLRAAMYRQRVTWWRRARRGREVSTADLPERADSRDAPAQVDLSLALRAALRRLAPGYRAVLVLRYLEDLPDHEIAAILGCQPSTVRSQATRALSQLRTIPTIGPLHSGQWFSPDGIRIAVPAEDVGLVQIVDSRTGRVYEEVPVPGWSRKDWGWLIGWAGDDHLVLRRPFPPGEARQVDHELVVVDLSGNVVQEVEPLRRWDGLYVSSSDGLAPAGAPYTFGVP